MLFVLLLNLKDGFQSGETLQELQGDMENRACGYLWFPGHEMIPEE